VATKPEDGEIEPKDLRFVVIPETLNLDTDQITMSVESAWNPPDGFLDVLYEKFPNLETINVFCEPLDDYGGYTIRNPLGRQEWETNELAFYCAEQGWVEEDEDGSKWTDIATFVEKKLQEALTVSDVLRENAAKNAETENPEKPAQRQNVSAVSGPTL